MVNAHAGRVVPAERPRLAEDGLRPGVVTVRVEAEVVIAELGGPDAWALQCFADTVRGSCLADPDPTDLTSELERFEFDVAHGDPAIARARLGEIAERLARAAEALRSPDAYNQRLADELRPWLEKFAIGAEAVAALADDIAQERRSDADMRQQIASLLRDTDQRLSDFDRRLSVVEAKPMPALARAASGRASAGTLSAMRVAVSAPPPPGGRPYEIRAASPGVAVLGTLDGTPAVVEIAVGDQVPGYGRVNAIAQKGHAWAVLCEHGTIE